MEKEIAGRLRRWQVVTVGLMVLGYCGYYLCRANYSVSLPLLIGELSADGLSAEAAKVRLGLVASAGTLAYALGKIAAGCGTDVTGGRRGFLVGMFGSVLFTVLFALGGGIPLFTAAWVGNRFAQAFGWVGMVKMAGRWFSYSAYGRVMGVLSLSYLFGDAGARMALGGLLRLGYDWRVVFLAAAGVLALLFLASAPVLRNSPLERGLPEPPDSPGRLVTEPPAKSSTARTRLLVRTFLTNPAFLMLCGMSLGLHLVRETFNTWTPTYFTQGLGLTAESAAGWSSLFPLFGGLAVVLAGFQGDRLGQNGRGLVLVWGTGLATAALALLANAPPTGMAPVLLVALVGFLILGPYSYLSGCLALDLGGKEGAATACGLIDGIGYLGGVLAGGLIASVSEAFGWSGAFRFLAGVAAVTTVIAAAYCRSQRRAFMPGPVAAPADHPGDAPAFQ